MVRTKRGIWVCRYSSLETNDSKEQVGNLKSWTKFWNWYENKILGSVIILAVIQLIQIPHMVWNADMMLEQGYVSRLHPILDWFLYGVDLIEIISITQVIMMLYSIVRKRHISNQ
jgi:hypothetical protein